MKLNSNFVVAGDGGTVFQRECFPEHIFGAFILAKVSNGFLEGIVRGYKAGILTENNYKNLTQCETLEGTSVKQDSTSLFMVFSLDFRQQLSSTDYGNFLANEPLPLSTSRIAEKATQLLVDQFNFIRANAVEPLSTFLEYIT